MAIWNDKIHTKDVLEAANVWKKNCFLGDGSLFLKKQLWTEQNLDELKSAFLNNPIHGDAKFIEKLKEQLGQLKPNIQQLGAECLWLLFLFLSSSQMGPIPKRDRLSQIWSLSGESLPDSALLRESALGGIGKPGTAFMTKMPDELGYLLNVVDAFKKFSESRRSELVSDPWKFGEWLDKQPGSDRRAFRHMLSFLIFPESYERIASWRQKRKIREAFAEKLETDERQSEDWSILTTDKIIFSIRSVLEEQLNKKEIDFYLPPLRSQWRESDGEEHNDSQSGSGEGRRFWIEKTLVSGRQNRESGEHALGKALWSPQKSKSGGDIYANMRRVSEGDVVFHLTDNEAISGVSTAAGSADDSFSGLTGTDWEGPAYRIQLSSYKPLDPPLPRSAFLEIQPFATELLEYASSGAKGLFYNNRGTLNQGAYLTEATPVLLSILNRAYQSYTGESLPYIEDLPKSELDLKSEKGYSIDDALEALFLEREEIEDILLLWTAKKNIVLQGPPGVGKSFAAQKLAFALIGKEDRDRLGFVQFHQSYSYEDFVEGFRPTDTGFELRAGKFVEFCRRAELDPHNSYVFVIDEINRGNLSKIFGELMLLIENDKRDVRWAMPLASGKLPFYVPANVHLLGLMNTADRSLAVVDYALRRRFAFLDLKPRFDSPKFRAQLERAGIQSNLLNALIDRIGALNHEIIADVVGLGAGFAIGHSFFCSGPIDSEDGASWYDRVIRTEIAPLLREYWFDAPNKAKSWEAQLLAPL